MSRGGDQQKRARRFLQKFTQLYIEFQHSDDAEGMARRIHAELSDWLVNPITRIDAQLGASVPEQDKQRTQNIVRRV